MNSRPLSPAPGEAPSSRRSTALLALFAGQFVLAEALLRLTKGPWDALPLALGALGSVPLWLVLAGLARKSLLRIPVALVASALLVCQSAFFLRYGYFLDRQILQVAASQRREIWPVLGPALPWLGVGTALVAALQFRLLGAARQLHIRRHFLPIGLAPVVATALLLPLRRGTSDLRILDSLGAFAETPAEARPVPVAVPQLHSRDARIPNVVVILTESVRSDSYCSSPTPGCRSNPRVNELLPDRVGLPQLRSLASFTGLSLSTLITGRSQVAPGSEVAAMPTLFEYAKAVRAEGDSRAPYTAFWSAHFAPVFARKDLHETVDSFVTFEDLTGPNDSYENIDVRLLRHFEQHLKDLPEPYFLVLHFYETHVPYHFDDADAPFTPWSRTVTWASLPGLFNAYRNAIYTQDQKVGAAVSALLADPRADNTVLLFTSDHGDEFDEHHQIHHGQDLYDEQIHVPGWVHWGKSALTDSESRALRDNAGRFLTHLDLTPTILDIYGVWDDLALQHHRLSMPGRSLLRPITEPMRPVLMSNCTEHSPCPSNTWGVLAEDRKLHATTWDTDWTCSQLGPSPEQPLSLQDPTCQSLLTFSRTHFQKLPSGRANW